MSGGALDIGVQQSGGENLRIRGRHAGGDPDRCDKLPGGLDGEALKGGFWGGRIHLFLAKNGWHFKPCHEPIFDLFHFAPGSRGMVIVAQQVKDAVNGVTKYFLFEANTA
jgi:hypothetical protein